ncbi:DUF2058 domain-containing protein [Luteimonas sp. BDR2-5]|uniref:DUF2058 domain-containing protein n=1 Tax=Proluteimonas luteida TaxID=2878685 RepID=UPI001E42304C|nr:DUF2058 domain-containing protein [Luteimonas sp. BDR2-5]MCD9026663.1 DUF2058 domain-containing protein [Luteimonas sp. BDR2-5]
MRNPLQEQLLKAGLVKKGKVAQVVREQAKARQGKQPPAPSPAQQEIERLRQEKAGRDRALAAEHNRQARIREQKLQARQLILDARVSPEGERLYRFATASATGSVIVGDAQARQLASGALVIAALDGGHAVIPRAVADKVRARDPDAIVVDHAAMPQVDDGDGTYDDPRFAVPDDLVW